MLKNGGVTGRTSSVKRERKRDGLGALRESECSKNGCGKKDTCKKRGTLAAREKIISAEKRTRREVCAETARVAGVGMNGS